MGEGEKLLGIGKKMNIELLLRASQLGIHIFHIQPTI